MIIWYRINVLKYALSTFRNGFYNIMRFTVNNDNNCVIFHSGTPLTWMLRCCCITPHIICSSIASGEVSLCDSVRDKVAVWVTLHFSRSHLIPSGVCWPFVSWLQSHAGTVNKLAKSQCWHSGRLLFTGHCSEEPQYQTWHRRLQCTAHKKRQWREESETQGQTPDELRVPWGARLAVIFLTNSNTYM